MPGPHLAPPFVEYVQALRHVLDAARSLRATPQQVANDIIIISAMKDTQIFRTHAEAEAYRERLKKIDPGISVSIFIRRGRYACLASGERLTEAVIQEALQRR